MRTFEDFMVGEVMTFGPVDVTAEDIKSFAERFDPQPMHLHDNADQNTVVSGMFASGLHTVCLQMRLMSDGLLSNSTSMGSPGMDEIRYLAPVRAGDRLTLRLEITSARPSKSRPEMGLIGIRCQMINVQCMPVLEMIGTAMFGRRRVAGADEAT
jgi:acyl dehydratase